LGLQAVCREKSGRREVEEMERREGEGGVFILLGGQFSYG